MFARSAAPDTAQGRAIQAVNERWGDNHHDEMPFRKNRRKGRESIGIPVCKKKYKPFHFEQVVMQPDDGTSDVRVEVVVERLYGCRCHHPQRKRVIERHGVRNDWQPFGVWSLAKAQAQAKCETMRLNRELREQTAATTTTTTTTTAKMTDREKMATAALSSSSSDDDDDDDDDEVTETGSRNSKNLTVAAAATASIVKRKPCRTMCLNGKCTWKVRSAYDNIYKEIHGESEDDER